MKSTSCISAAARTPRHGVRAVRTTAMACNPASRATAAPRSAIACAAPAAARS